MNTKTRGAKVPKPKTTKTPKPKTYQEQYDSLKEAIQDMGATLWEKECHVNLYGTHLEVSAGGYVKYEFLGCDTPAKILDALRETLKGVADSIRERRDELDNALTYAPANLGG